MATSPKRKQQISYQDDLGMPILLGKELARGGEGKVCLVQGNSNVVAKIYLDKALQKHDKAGKIKTMCDLFDPDVATFSALPQRAIFDSRGKVVGFIMEKITDFKEIHNLYGISTKRKLFNFANWRFMVHTAQNLACAVNTLHEKGIVIGDINQGNILVDNQAMIKLIDCDSYQVEHNGKIYFCEVGVPEYTSPELQGMSFNGITRSKNHDCFGLAVMIFKILMFGRHPYSGVGAPPEIENAIKRGCYCFGLNAKGLTPIYSKLVSEVLNDEIKELFERAFSKKQNCIRPTAKEWIQALGRFEQELQECRQGHKYYSKRNFCIWCELEKIGFKPFDNNTNNILPKQTPYKPSNTNIPKQAPTPKPTPALPSSPTQTLPPQPQKQPHKVPKQNFINKFANKHPVWTTIIVICFIILRIFVPIDDENTTINQTTPYNQENYQAEQSQKTYTEAEKQADLKAYKDNFIRPIQGNYNPSQDNERNGNTEVWFELSKRGNILDSNWNYSKSITQQMTDAIHKTMHVSDEIYVADSLPDSYDKDSLRLNLIFTESGVYYKGTEPKEQPKKQTDIQNKSPKITTTTQEQKTVSKPSISPEEELANYKQKVIQKIRANWKQPDSGPWWSNDAAAEIVINKQGYATWKITKTSSLYAEHSMRDLLSINFEPLPKGYASIKISIAANDNKIWITSFNPIPVQSSATKSATPSKNDLQKTSDYLFE